MIHHVVRPFAATRVIAASLAIAMAALPAFALDEDQDGMSDVWQRVHSIATGDRDSDPDGDGCPNWLEEAFGSNPHAAITDPADGMAGMAALSTDFLSGGQAVAVISVPSRPGIFYQVEGRNSGQTPPADWAPIGAKVYGDGSPEPLRVPDIANPLVAGVAREYRVVALRAPALGHVSPDRDADGLDAFEEFLLGTSDTRVDSDGDGFTDTWEFNHYQDPAVSQATTTDWDGDGLTNAQEADLVTSPMLADTDGDGVGDALDSFPLDPTRHAAPVSNLADTTAPVITLDAPANAVELP